ncbi:MAG: fumarylacetoacetate hydrolase family protein [Actinomycetota bacterium]|nr:fumarylacetoacetate hydrolase family protein [Actinomycetota bacterium]
MQPRLAVATGGRKPVDLLAAAAATGSFDLAADSWLVSTAHLVDAGPEVWERVKLVAAEAPEEFEEDWDRDEVKLLCPLDRAASLRDFLAFEDHVKRGAERRGGAVPDYWYEAPVYYKGNHRSLIGPEDDCPWPAYSEYLDFELELAMILGRKGRDVAPEAAEDFIFGFTILNDFSARDIQMKEVTAWLGPAKGKDFCNALGPCIVTADELGAQPDLEMRCSVNGEEWGRGRSGDVRWTWGQMVAHVSRSEDIYPGDIYGSGTPGGCCGLDLDRKLSPGDLIELDIERIGTLRNRVGQRA